MSSRSKKRWNRMGLTPQESLIVRLDSRARHLADPEKRRLALSLLRQWQTSGNLSNRQWHSARRLARAPLAGFETEGTK